MSHLADLLEAQRDAILRRWEAASAEGLASGGATQPELCEQMPDWLQEAARALRQPDVAAATSTVDGDRGIGRAHGAPRFRFDVARSFEEVVRAYGALLHVVLDVVEQTGAPVPLSEVRRFSDLLTGVVAEAIAEHTRRQADEERAEADRARLLDEAEAARAQAVAEKQRLNDVFMQTPVPLAILEGPAYAFAFANPAFRALVNDRDVAGKPLLEAFPELKGQGFDVLLDRVWATGEPLSAHEMPVKLEHHGEGESLILNFSYTPLRDGAGSVTGVFVTIVDVTEQVVARRRVEALAERLREREEYLRSVLESSRTGTWGMDVATGQLTADARFRELFGLTLDEPFDLEQGLAIIHEGDRDRVAKAVADAIAGKDDGRYAAEYRAAQSPNGKPFWVEARGQAVFDEGGKAVRFFGTGIDITARKEAEAALAVERDTLEAIFRDSPAAMAVWRGRDFVFVRVNPQYAAIFPGRELVGKPLFEAVPELIGQGVDELLQKVLDTGEPFVGHDVPTQLVRREGGPLEDHNYDLTYVRVDNTRGEPYGVYVHAVDVTDRVVARKKLEESEERLRLALRGGHMGAWSYHVASNRADGDAQYRALHGYSDEFDVTAAIEDTIHPDDRARVRAAIGSALESGMPYACEYRVLMPGGSTRWVYSRGEPKLDAQQRPVSMSGVSFDIDERKQAEGAREQLVAALREREAELERQHAFEQHLVGIVSHDLRNPITAILMGTTALLRLDDLSGRATRVVMRIQSSAERSERMIRDLLDFTQARLGGSIQLDRRAADLHEVTRAVLDEVDAAHPERDVVVERAGDGRGSWDVDRVSQVVTNLMANALKYSPEGTPVRVRTAGEGDTVTLSVHNEGPPIPPERLSRIFEPLQRASGQGDRHTRSIGLGLYIVDAIVQAHGGSVGVTSTEADGTTFTVRLPR